MKGVKGFCNFLSNGQPVVFAAAVTALAAERKIAASDPSSSMNTHAQRINQSIQVSNIIST